MSVEQARTFLTRLNDDEELAEKADDAFVGALLAVATQAGYDVSEGELRAALDGGDGAMGDQELDEVAGGFALRSAALNLGSVADTLYGGGSLANTVYGGMDDTLSGGLSLNSFSKKGFTKTR